MSLIIPEFTDEEIAQLINLVHQYTGITLGDNPKIMLQMRLRNRFRELNCRSLSDYFRYLKQDQNEVQAFINSVTTNETYFFRTKRVWDHLENCFLEDWYHKNPQSVFHAWSAASSSGEEAYSLGMILYRFQQTHPGFQFRIIGTDISEKALKKAQTGAYQGRVIDLIKKDRPEFLELYFTDLKDGSFCIKSEIQKNIVFKRHHLFETLKDEILFDLVLVRNVLIYFNSHDQERAIELILRKTKTNALVVVGESESLNHIKTNLDYLSPLLYQYRTVA